MILDAFKENPTIEQIRYRKKLFIDLLKYIKTLNITEDDIAYIFGSSKLIERNPKVLQRVIDSYDYVSEGKEWPDIDHDKLDKELRLVAQFAEAEIFTLICPECEKK